MLDLFEYWYPSNFMNHNPKIIFFPAVRRILVFKGEGDKGRRDIQCTPYDMHLILAITSTTRSERASTRSNPTALDPSVEGAALQLSILTSRTREEHDETHAMLRLRRPIVLAFRTRRTSHENRSSRHLAERMLELFPRDTTI